MAKKKRGKAAAPAASVKRTADAPEDDQPKPKRQHVDGEAGLVADAPAVDGSASSAGAIGVAPSTTVVDGATEAATSSASASATDADAVEDATPAAAADASSRSAGAAAPPTDAAAATEPAALAAAPAATEAAAAPAVVENSPVWFTIDRSVVGAVIGKGGSVIKALRERTGASIKVQDATPEEQGRTVTIDGTKEQVEAAYEEVRKVVEAAQNSTYAGNSGGGGGGGGGGTVPKEGEIVQTLMVPGHLAGGVIGRGGSSIKQIRDASGARVRLESQPVAGSTERVCTITGPPASVQYAAQLIAQKLSIAQEQGGGGGGGGGGGYGAAPQPQPPAPYYGGAPGGAAPYGAGYGQGAPAPGAPPPFAGGPPMHVMAGYGAVPGMGAYGAPMAHPAAYGAAPYGGVYGAAPYAPQHPGYGAYPPQQTVPGVVPGGAPGGAPAWPGYGAPTPAAPPGAYGMQQQQHIAMQQHQQAQAQQQQLQQLQHAPPQQAQRPPHPMGQMGPYGGGVVQVRAGMGNGTVQVEVPSDLIGRIIGRGGEKINSVRQQTGAVIQILDAVSQGASTRTISIG
jgi:predicted RNA-binding protein YlqC (UPF0109 family)